MSVELMFYVRDGCYLDGRVSLCPLWPQSHSLLQTHLIFMSYLSRYIGTSCVDGLGMDSVSTKNFVRTPCCVPPKGPEDGHEILLIVWLRPVF